MGFTTTIGIEKFSFATLKILMAKASPKRSADELARIAANNEIERVAAQIILADIPLKSFLEYEFISYDKDEVTRLIFDSHNKTAFAKISSFTVGEFREWLLSYQTTSQDICEIQSGLTPEMVAAVSKIMRIQDLITVAKKIRVVTQFRNSIGLEGCLSTRLQPNHPTDDPKGVLVSIIDGLLLGSGDAVIGLNPASDNPHNVITLLKMIDDLRIKYNIPTQSCILSHVTTSIQCIELGAPVDLVFQSIAGSEKANQAFGISLNLLKGNWSAPMKYFFAS